jgi:hypothetical protein
VFIRSGGLSLGAERFDDLFLADTITATKCTSRHFLKWAYDREDIRPDETNHLQPLLQGLLVGCNEEVQDFVRGVDEHVDVFGAVLGRMTHELDGLSWRLAIAEEKLAGLVPMVIDTSYEEPSVEFEVGVGQEVPIRDMVRTLVPIKNEPQVGDSPPLRFTRSLRRLNDLVEELVDRSQARELSDYETAPLGDIGELFQL